MKLLITLILSCTTLISTVHSAEKKVKQTKTKLFPKSMKGYYLYHYQKQGKNLFVLITGTNWLRPFKELDKPASIETDRWVHIRVEGIDAANNFLKRIPKGTPVFADSIFTRPGQNASKLPKDIHPVPAKVLKKLNLPKTN